MTRAELKSAIAHVPNTLGPAHLLKQPATTRKRNRDREHQDQVEIFRWARAEGGAEFPELRTALFHAIPNGGMRGMLTAKKLKAEGVTRGIADMALDVARAGFFGAKIEQKVDGQPASPEQIAYAQAVIEQGFFHRFCFSAEETKRQLRWYLEQPPTTAKPCRKR